MGKQAEIEAAIIKAIESRQKRRKWGSTRFVLSVQDGELTGCKVEDKDTYRQGASMLPETTQSKWPCDRVKEIFQAWKDIRLSGQASLRACYENGVVTILEKEDSFVVRIA